jgi:hypothetical protein
MAIASSSLPEIQEMAKQADVIIRGHVAKASADVATIDVEEIWKGQVSSESITVNNHHFIVNDDCSLILGEPGRFSPGERIVLFLQNDEFNIGADWRPSGPGGTYILEIKGDELW